MTGLGPSIPGAVWNGQQGDATEPQLSRFLSTDAPFVAEPVGGFRPTDGWQTGERIIDRCGVLVPAGLPAGRYTVRVGLYDFQGERLPVVWPGGEGDGLVIGTVEVEGE